MIICAALLEVRLKMHAILIMNYTCSVVKTYTIVLFENVFHTPYCSTYLKNIVYSIYCAAH